MQTIMTYLGIALCLAGLFGLWWAQTEIEREARGVGVKGVE